MTTDTRVTVTAREFGDSGWEPRDADVAELRSAIENGRLIWVDIGGTLDEITTTLAELAEGSAVLEGIEAKRAARGGESPPKFPPKAKAFRNCVFGRTYWLGMELGSADEPERLVAQEVHVIAGESFAITMHFGLVAWNLHEDVLEARSYPEGERFWNSEKVMASFADQRQRLDRPEGRMVFGLEIAAVVLDSVIDSVFDSLNALRDLADGLEQRALKGQWLWKKEHPSVERRMLGLRRLLRQVRWAFMPADEIAEFLSGPFIEVEEQAKGLAFRFTDLRREATRAVEVAKDVTEQAQNAVELVNTMKADRLNNTTYVLTVVATVLLIPTLIAGIYGMNFRYMPELGWRPGYWTVLGVMVVLGFTAWLLINRYLRRGSGG